MFTAGTARAAVPAADRRASGAGVVARILVRFAEATSATDRDRANSRFGGKRRHEFGAPPGLELIELPAGTTVAGGLARYRRDPAVERVEPDWPIEAHVIPGDPRFPDQWQLENTGQTGGTVDADINATGAWDVTPGNPDLVAAVIDSGIDYTHPDLAGNVWVNPGEIPGNGLDDDQNGYVDDVHGIDAITGSGDPMDDYGHGTQMAGLIGAVGDDAGMTGVARHTSLLACKSLDSSGRGTISAAIACLDYIRALKTRATAAVPIVAINASWGGAPYSQSLADAIAASRAAGVLFIASAGNGGGSIEDPTSLAYPARFGLPLVVSVGASDAFDRLSSFSVSGATAVHLLSPGASLLVPALGGGYTGVDGTSPASAVATGVVMLLASAAPGIGPEELADLLLAGGQPISAAAGTTATGRRLRAWDTGGVGSLSCTGQDLHVRVAPPGPTILSVRGRSVVPLSMLDVDCGTAVRPSAVAVDDDGSVSLADDGLGADRYAGDGLSVGSWLVSGDSGASTHKLAFSVEDTVTVRVLDTYEPAEPVAFEWRTLSGQALALTDDASAAITVPFAIPFAHAEGGFSALWVHSNGYIDFSGTKPWADNESLPSPRLGTALAPFWDDLDPSIAGSVQWGVLGEAPHRELVIEWDGVAHHEVGAANAVTFQAVMFEDRSDVVFSYADVSVGDPGIDRGSSATIGIQEAAPNGGGVATVFSTDAASLAAGTSLLWRANEPPVASPGSAQGVRGGEVVTLDGSGSHDPDGALTSVAWRQTAGPGILLSSPDAPVTTFMAPFGPAVLELELTVTDDDGVTSRARTRVVVGNQPPSAILTAPAGPFAEGEQLEIQLTIEDPDGPAGGPYRVTWSWGDGATGGDTLLAPTSVALRHTFADDAGSPFELAAEITDAVAGDGSPTPESLTAIAHVSLVVHNAAPRIESVAVEPRPAVAGKPVTITVVAHDPGSDALSYSFDFDGDGSFDVLDSAEPRATVTFAEPGFRNVAILASDGDGGEDHAVAPLTISSEPPAPVRASGCTQAGSPTAGLFLAMAVLIFRRVLCGRPSTP